MAKKALLDVLEKTIGKYVLNLDAESLNVAVWSGTIQLNSLELNIQAVNAELDRQAAEAPNLALPFRVTSGSFASFQVDVPWARLMSEPVVLRARGLSVEMEPFDRAASADFLYAFSESETARAKKIKEHRLLSIRLAEEYRQQASVLRKLAEQDLTSTSSSRSASSDSANSSFAARLARRILENIQIEISDVRIVLKGAEGSAGVVLESLQLVTTDSDGKLTFVDRTTGNDAHNSFLHKVLKISGLGAYLDEKSSRRMINLTSIQEEGDFQRVPHSFVLAPLSFAAKLRQADSNDCIDYPKYLLESEVQNLSVLLSKTQLEVWQKIMVQIRPTLSATRPLFPEYRPAARISSGPVARDWWKYAIRCIGRLNGSRLWVEFFLAFRKRKQYIPLYKRHRHAAQCSWLTPLTIPEMAELFELEQDRSISVEGLMTWRSIADAQVEKEREKDDAKKAASAPKTSLFTSLFGSPQSQPTGGMDEPPVSLTTEEMKELEAITMEQVADSELSKDSRLADVRFVLRSLDICLSSHESRQLAILEMGTASASFDVNADGSYAFDFSLKSLEILDRATPQTLFPSILKNQVTNNLMDIWSDAFHAHVAKTKSGDQHLLIQLNTFESVLSPLSLTELKRFLSLSPVSCPSKATALNPVLAQSLSGSVDLFYDATEGTVPNQIYVGGIELPSATKLPVSDLSHALVEAWKVKTETKSAWVIDLDIHAPIILVPENCVDPRANVLVFDLGQLRLQYGKIETSRKVKQWFLDHSNCSSPDNPILDCGSLSISNLTFVVGKNNYWQRLVRTHESLDTALDEEVTVFEPVSLSIEFGVESTKTEAVPRVCSFGVIPLISLRVSPSQLSRISRVVGAWLKLYKDLSGPGKLDANVEQGDSGNELQSRSSSHAQKMILLEEARRSSVFLASTNPESDRSIPLFFIDLRLQRFSLAVGSGEGSGMEAHLVSVAASFTSISDSSSVSKVSMGWFWVLDRLEHDFPRKQRLIVHSRLPKSPEEFALDDRYDVLDELRHLGVFEQDFDGSTELADILLKQSGGISLDRSDSFQPGFATLDDYVTESVIDAKFSSLRVNWNPAAVKTILSTFKRYAALLDANSTSEVGPVILSSPDQLQPRHHESAEEPIECFDSFSVVRVVALMEKFEISLNSARDDLPLFVLSMSTTKLSILSSVSENMELFITLDDLRVETPATGRTDPIYRTILGLAPGRSESLLRLRFFTGEKALSTISSDVIDAVDLEAYAQVGISPMRLVYIHSQVLALVEYTSEGILGALTAQAASSAAAAAREIASTTSGKKKRFLVEATGLEVVLPEAAYTRRYVALSTGATAVEYTSFPEPGGSRASIRLSDFMLSDSSGVQMQEKAVQMSVNVSLPPQGVGSEDDQAMRVGIEISEAPFILSKMQYAQILHTLDTNIGEPDLCVRDVSQEHVDKSSADSDASFLHGLTHSGVAIVENKQRMYVEVTLSALSLMLCADDADDPIVRVAAVEALVSMKQFVAEGRMKTRVTLNDLVCTDNRIKTIGRQYRTLIYQATSKPITNESIDVFTVEYESRKDHASSYDLTIGSPRIVFIPDAVSDIMSFLDVDRPQQSTSVEPTYLSETLSYQAAGFEVETSAADDQIEASVVKKDLRTSSSMTFHLKTSRCSFIMVDLGSNSLLPASYRPTSTAAALSESIVCEGVFDSHFQSTTDLLTGCIIASDAQFHAMDLEMYTAYGLDLNHPLQILEPTQLTIYMTSNSTGGKSRSTVDLRAAALTPINLTFSMRNLALVNAIMSSISESFDTEAADHADTKDRLDSVQTKQIEHLAELLEVSGDSESSVSGAQASLCPTNADDAATGEVSAEVPDRIISVKITLPEATVSIVNDLQGLDEALLRVAVRSMMSSCQLREGEHIATFASSYTGFDWSAHASVLADYFDVATNQWRPLLLKPWEISAKAARAGSSRFKSPRPSTTIDVDSYSCAMSFSEQFLMNIASANQMWSVYTAATSSASESGSRTAPAARRDSVRMSLAASAARTLTTSHPYALENHTGISVAFVVHDGSEQLLECGSDTMEYFRFNPPTASGSGGKRVYGQDVNYEKSVTLLINESRIKLDNVDSLIGFPRQAHEVDSKFIVVSVAKEGKTVVIHLSSGLDLHNGMSLPVAVGIASNGKCIPLGICSASRRKQLIVLNAGKASKPSQFFGVPSGVLSSFWQEWKNTGRFNVPLSISPEATVLPEGWKFEGAIDITIDRAHFRANTALAHQLDVTCKPVRSSDKHSEDPPPYLAPFVLHVKILSELVGGHFPAVDITLEARAVLENCLPVALSVRTPMPHTYSEVRLGGDGQDAVHCLCPGELMEIFTPGPSIAVSMSCAENPVAGTSTGWMKGWVDLPLVPEFRFPEAVKCEFPFVRKSPDPLSLSGAKGSEFLVADGGSILADLSEDSSLMALKKDHVESDSMDIEVSAPPAIGTDEWRTFLVTVYNYGVDHTGDILFEQVDSSARQFRRSSSDTKALHGSLQPSRQVSPPFGAFGSARHHGRISLLPGSNVLVRLLHLTMEGCEGMKRSQPFRVEDVPICDGGVESSQLTWEDGSPSGFFAYRNLVSSFQSEIHIIPEYVVFNGSKSHTVRVKQPGGMEMLIGPGKLGPLRTHAQETATISVALEGLNASTSPLRVDSLGPRIAVVKSSDGNPIGSIVMQTAVGSKDSRLVVKLGELKFGGLSTPERMQASSWLEKDFLRFRIQWTELRITLDEGRPVLETKQAFFKSAWDRIRADVESDSLPVQSPPKEAGKDFSFGEARSVSNPVCTIQFARFTIDWQRVFKDEEPSSAIRSTRDALRSPERSQLSVVVYNVLLRDETPNTPYPIVFDSTSEVSFFDLCIRCRGPLDTELVKVDLFDLNLAHANGVSQKIFVSTCEDFVWRMLDLANRILSAVGEISGVDMELKWDEEQEGYVVSFRDKKSSNLGEDTKYTPPSSQFYDIARARVSPFSVVLTFKRNPQSSRYKLMKGGKGANLMNYFTRRLKFKIDRAELNFARYEVRNIKGPPDRLVELLSTVYLSRAKVKFLTIMTATSFQDWKSLASRDDGDDEFVEGDILRVTGNLAGNTVNYILRQTGKGIGKGVTTVTNTLGEGIENVTGAIGVRAVGAGVNSIVSGVGDGVSSTITGVGTGAGKVLLGAGQGAGAVFGGLTGGALIIGKGIGKGITTGDGRAVVSGVSDGVSSLGAGVGHGIESVVTGTRDGVLSVGQGLFSGVKSVGKGIGGAFRGKTPEKKQNQKHY